LCQPKQDAWDLDLLEGVRAHKSASTDVGVQELHRAPLKFQIFQPFLRAEVRLPQPATPHIEQPGLNHSTHFGGPGFRFKRESEKLIIQQV